MSPYEIKKLLHVYTTPAAFPYEERSVPLHAETMAQFMNDDLITAVDVCCVDDHPYKLTARGQAYLDALMAMPLPVCETRWVIPPHNQGSGQ